MKNEIAEFIGTFTLVLVGCGAAVYAGDVIGPAGIGWAFGLALITMAYTIGSVSGCHINPAVSLGSYLAGRLDINTTVRYIIAQCLGGIAGAFVVLTIAKGGTGFDLAASGLGQNGWGEGYGGGYGELEAFVFEALATFLFVLLILQVTAEKTYSAVAGLIIGLALVGIHLVGIQITGVSLNPARSLGPALLVGEDALDQLWLFIVAPLVGGGAAGFLVKNGLFGK
jgi:aquaporin Z